MTKLRNTWLPLLALLAVASVSCGPGGEPPPPPDGDVEVRVVVTGPGSVVRVGESLACDGDCLWELDAGVDTSIEAVPAPGFVFVAWTGVCDAFENPCVRRFQDADAVTATFARHALRLDLTGDGEGAFSIQGPGIATTCTDDCGLGLDLSLEVAVYAFPSSARTTVEEAWTGPCLAQSLPNYCLVGVTGVTTVGKTWRHPPVALDDAYGEADGATRNATLTVAAANGVLANDDDTLGDVLTALLVDDVGHGTLALRADGGFTYTPDAGYVGPDGFRYRVRDAFGSDDAADVTITVVNRPPIAADDVYETDRDETLAVAAPGLLANDGDPDGDALILALVADVANGTLALADDGGFTYTPDPDFAGSDTFTYTVSDGVATSAVASVTIGVDNEAPVAVDDDYATSGAGTLTVDAADGVLANDADANGDDLTAVLVDDASNGTLALAPDGSFTYTPDAGYTGPDAFTYVANDGIVDGNTATVTLTVTNLAPVAASDAYGMFRNGTLIVAAADGVLDNDGDPDGDPLTAILVTPPASGLLALAANGGFSYTPPAGSTAPVTFTYAASDGIDESVPATVSITITNRPPVASPDAYGMFRNGTLTTTTANDVLTNDIDPDGDPLTAVLITPPANGAFAFRADGTFTYTPPAGSTAPATFTYAANDGLTDGNTVTVTINVSNRPPTAIDDTDYETAADTALVVPAPGVLDNDTDPDGDPLTVTVFTQPTGGAGSVTVNPDGSFAFTPSTGYTGVTTFGYTASDGLTTDTANVTITVIGP